MTNQPQSDFGALVGWKCDLAGDRVTLNLQSVSTPPPVRTADVHQQMYFMTRQQAILLGNYLFDMVGETKPDFESRGLLARLFG
jgi:hypothetical protein